MEYIIALCASFVALIIMAVVAIRQKDKKLPCLLGGVGAALLSLILPFSLTGSALNIAKGIILSFVQVLQIFSFGGNYEASLEAFGSLPVWIPWVYILLLAVLYLVAPLLTLSFVLSMFKNASAYMRWVFSRKSRVTIFSCATERTATLAKSVREGKIVFCGECDSYIRRLIPKKAIVFSNPLSALKPRVLKKPKSLTVYLAEEDERRNLLDAIEITEYYKAEKIKEEKKPWNKISKYFNDKKGDKAKEAKEPKVKEKPKKETRERTLYVFSTHREHELVLNGIDKGDIHVRRINEARSVVYSLIAKLPLFERAVERDGRKHISAMLVGCGRYGDEMMRALVWSCCREGYYLTVNIIEKQDGVEKLLRTSYPGLFDTEALPDAPDINYRVNVFDGTDINAVDMAGFIAREKSAEDTEFVFVATGSDRSNLEIAIHLRESFSRVGLNPIIQTDVNELGKTPPLKNHKGNDYSIDTLSKSEVHSYDTLIAPKLEATAFKLHEMWNDDVPDKRKADFYKYEYCYRSSMAQALFWTIRKEQNQNMEVSEKNQRLEHTRWNAYMRTEGYIYGEKNNTLGKQHMSLTAFDNLDNSTKGYDTKPMLLLGEEKTTYKIEVYNR